MFYRLLQNFYRFLQLLMMETLIPVSWCAGFIRLIGRHFNQTDCVIINNPQHATDCVGLCRPQIGQLHNKIVEINDRWQRVRSTVNNPHFSRRSFPPPPQLLQLAGSLHLCLHSDGFRFSIFYLIPGTTFVFLQSHSYEVYRHHLLTQFIITMWIPFDLKKYQSVQNSELL